MMHRAVQANGRDVAPSSSVYIFSQPTGLDRVMRNDERNCPPVISPLPNQEFRHAPISPNRTSEYVCPRSLSAMNVVFVALFHVSTSSASPSKRRGEAALGEDRKSRRRLNLDLWSGPKMSSSTTGREFQTQISPILHRTVVATARPGKAAARAGRNSPPPNLSPGGGRVLPSACSAGQDRI